MCSKPVSAGLGPISYGLNQISNSRSAHCWSSGSLPRRSFKACLTRAIGALDDTLVLVGYSRSINMDPLEGNMASLPLLIYTELVNPEAAGALRVWGAALTLILIIAALYLGAAFVNRYLTRNRV